ncbi:dehydrodolichyl diphosphate synthase complex subunit nus1-like [Diadema antillarum]|uniref:dehydrodolichyl diphosphate synthase complex subunit nus1-like n=1 Tax=Diadema antillarum TaxID=105358 RepID=UPI003A83690A
MAVDTCSSILLRFVHVLIWIRIQIAVHVSIILNRVSAALCNFDFQRKRMRERCRTDCKQLSKLPLHLGIQILENQVSEKDVASMLVWCMTMGIPYVTMFDVKGHLKNTASDFGKILEKRVSEVCTTCDQLVFQLEVPERNGSLSAKIVYKSSSEGSDKTRIALISSSDGRQDIVSAARKICQTVADKQSRASDVGIPQLDEHFNTSTVFPDPELIVQFGSVNSLVGFAPWKIRVTEIMTLPTHRSLNYSSFLGVLHSFSQTKQRYGK